MITIKLSLTASLWVLCASSSADFLTDASSSWSHEELETAEFWEVKWRVSTVEYPTPPRSPVKLLVREHCPPRSLGADSLRQPVGLAWHVRRPQLNLPAVFAVYGWSRQLPSHSSSLDLQTIQLTRRSALQLDNLQPTTNRKLLNLYRIFPEDPVQTKQAEIKLLHTANHLFTAINCIQVQTTKIHETTHTYVHDSMSLCSGNERRFVTLTSGKQADAYIQTALC